VRGILRSHFLVETYWLLRFDARMGRPYISYRHFTLDGLCNRILQVHGESWTHGGVPLDISTVQGEEGKYLHINTQKSEKSLNTAKTTNNSKTRNKKMRMDGRIRLYIFLHV
jgi:hypothetical protein